ncbi:unnamed protein product [Strongylus vulgaris]|uniref:Uncharacterized protein n=1 Tax=Strongylus vulgaris TaxID=40348 RepID=A0A3P7II90_STRVU|nr:unnamed protein product [Strongylus vulgaris]
MDILRSLDDSFDPFEPFEGPIRLPYSYLEAKDDSKGPGSVDNPASTISSKLQNSAEKSWGKYVAEKGE